MKARSRTQSELFYKYKFKLTFKLTLSSDVAELTAKGTQLALRHVRPPPANKLKALNKACKTTRGLKLSGRRRHALTETPILRSCSWAKCPISSFP